MTTIRRLSVVGAGTMGHGIAQVAALAGFHVSITDSEPAMLERGLARIRDALEKAIERGKCTREQRDAAVARLTPARQLPRAVTDSDLVIEAVPEELALKQRLFAEIEGYVDRATILASNTSSLSISEIARPLRYPERGIGLHFFNPVPVMRLLEIVRGERTAPDVLATAIAVARRVGKVPVVVGVCHGFVGNRMLRARGIEAERMLLEGALPHEVDGAIVEFGFPMGPFAMGDLAGLDVSWRMRKAQGAKAEIADRLCELGRFGQKTGKGFFLYEAGSRTPRPDPEVEKIIVDASARHGVARRSIAFSRASRMRARPRSSIAGSLSVIDT